MAHWGLEPLSFRWQAIALILHVQENLNLGATAYGLLLAAGAFGGDQRRLSWRIKSSNTSAPSERPKSAYAVSAPAFLAMALAPNWLRPRVHHRHFSNSQD